MKHIIHWVPRVLSIGVALFFALFALDVFGEFDSISETLIALFMHLIPTIIVLVAAAVAWHWPIVGGVVFLVLGGFSVMQYDTYKHPFTFLLISTPIFVAGLLFLWDALGSQNLDGSQHT